MTRPRFHLRYLFLTIAFWLAALGCWGLLSPWLDQQILSAGSVLDYAVEEQWRTAENEPWEARTLVAQRHDQVLFQTSKIIMVQGDLIWSTDDHPQFINQGLYAVDARTGENLPGYGDLERGGQYYFPPGTQRTAYVLWDPHFIGPRQVSYVRDDQIDGLLVYRFSFLTTGLDESDGYSSLPEVPERYLALTDGRGLIWVEPHSGLIVGYQEHGASYLADAANRRRLSEFHRWEDTFTAETEAAQLKLARRWRTWSLLVNSWLPLVLAVAGGLTLVLGGVVWARERSADPEARP